MHQFIITTWCCLVQLILLLNQGYCNELCADHIPDADKGLVNLKMECLHNGTVIITWEFKPVYIVFFQIEYLCYSKESEKINGNYSILNENSIALSFFTNESHCIARGCVSAESRDYPLPWFWIPTVTCNRTEPTVDNETTMPAPNNTYSYTLTSLSATSEMNTLLSINSEVIPTSSSTMETTISTTVHTADSVTYSSSDSRSSSSLIPPETIPIGIATVVLIVIIVMCMFIVLGLHLWVKKKRRRNENLENPVSALNAITLIQESPSLLSCTTNINFPIHKSEQGYVTKELNDVMNCFEMTNEPFSESDEKSKSLNIFTEFYDDKYTPPSVSPAMHNISITFDNTTDMLDNHIDHKRQISDQDSGVGTQESTESSNSSFQFTGNILLNSIDSGGSGYIQTLAISAIIPEPHDVDTDMDCYELTDFED